MLRKNKLGVCFNNPMPNTPDAKVLILQRIDKKDGHWLWRNSRNTYGDINLLGKSERAHRYSYQAFIGPIPPGKWVLHTCDVPSCVNPKHLYAGTHTDNMRDCRDRGRLVTGRYLGEQHPQATITNEQARTIRRLFRTTNLTQVQIAKQVGTTDRIVGHIVNNRRWQSVK